MTDGDSPDQAELTFPGDGEMARRMRAFDWANSPVGDPRDWPASLRTAVRICLTSRFPMIVWWGEPLSYLYNDAYLPLLGNKHPALMQPGRQVWHEIWDTIGPMLESVMRTGQATWSEDLLLPMDRHGYWEETYWTYSYSPLQDDDGTVRGVFTAVNDTTEQVVGRRRLAALQDLGAQAGQARSVTEACNLIVRSLKKASHDVPFAAVYLCQPDGALALASSTAAGVPGGWPVAEVVSGGQPIRVNDVVTQFGELPAGGWERPPTQAMVLPLTGGAAGAIVLAASAGRALDAAYESFLELVAQQCAGLISGAVALEVQSRRAEDLTELDRAKTTFFSNVSHEFRTPLTLIMGPVEELRSRPGVDRADAESLDVIYRNGMRLGKLVNTLLDFSRIEAGRVQASFEPLDLGAFTTELASLFHSAFDRAGIGYEVDCPPLGEPVYVDREMWEKVVFNLLSNALKYTFTGTVSVRLSAADGQAVLQVADTGAGVPAAELPRLFDRFHRIENTPARSNEGSGIGLALVRELVRLHGGTIEASSAERVGTTFTVRIPFGHGHLAAESVSAGSGSPSASAAVADASPFLLEAMRWLPGDAAAPDVEVAAAGRFDLGGKALPARVLLADDNADMREYLERLLRPGYQVTTVTDGEAALEAARADPPDILISDVMMPRLGGLALAEAIRADSRTVEVPVLLLSARAGQEAAIEGLEAGADDYLVKPFSAAELLARVRATVELARLRNHHTRWRAALLDSLHEAFYVVDEDGLIVEVNAGFSEIAGFGPEDLPYPLMRPWWPDQEEDPDRRDLVRDALRRLMTDRSGSFTVPLRRRDGCRIWVTGNFNELRDPDTGRRLVVGTFRDVTAEHYAVQREAALAAMGLVVSRAGNSVEVLREALTELQRLWQAREVTAATWMGSDPVTVTSTGTWNSWAALPGPLRNRLAGLRGQPVLMPVGVGSGWGADGSGVLDGASGGAGIRLEHPAGTLGIWLDLGTERELSAEDRTLLSLVGGYLGQALYHAYQTDQERETALTLQRAILGPSRLPAGFAVRYEPATRPLEVGGDWYDIVDLPDGRIGIMVGDSVGHDLRAATVMGQLRSACRALLLQDASASQALMAMDRFAALVPGAECATVFCGILDPETGVLSYSSAAHPPGIVVHPDGEVVLLEDGRSLPLAIQPGNVRLEASYTLPPRSTLLLYTDGLVERRRRPLTEGIEAAAAAVRDAADSPVEELASHVMTSMSPAGGYEDDVALVLYHHPAPLDLSFSAESEQLASVRSRLRGWLASCDVGLPVAQDVLVAAGEAIANAIEHGHRGVPGELVRLRAVSTADKVRLTVSDHGRWRPTPTGDRTLRGHGLALMRALMEQVTIEHDPTGTTVDMYVSLLNGAADGHTA